PATRTLLHKARSWVARLLCVAAGSFSLLASPPVKQDIDITSQVVLLDICGFPVTIDFTVTGTLTSFFDKSGNLVRVALETVEQDTFSANGKVLEGIPYPNNQEAFFDANGNITHIYGSGIYAKMRLPDGSLFISAGRNDINSPGWVISPDRGHTGD